MNPKELERYYLGEAALVEDPDSGEKLMTLSSTHNARGEVEALAVKLRERRKLKHANLVELRNIETDAQSSWCSTVYRLRSTYEYFPNSLRKEITIRRRKGQCFNGVELLRLIYDASDVLAYLQTNGIKHGELCPSLVFLQSDPFDGLLRLKLCEKLGGSANKYTNYINAVTAGVDLYISPTSFNALAAGVHPLPIEDCFKRDVFALGLCILEAGLLTSVQCIYSKAKGGFVQEKLTELRDNFSGLFSALPVLPFIVGQMLQPIEAERPDFLQLAQALPPWREVVEFLKKNPAAARPQGELCRLNCTFEEVDQSQNRGGPTRHHSINSMKDFEGVCNALKEVERRPIPATVQPNKPYVAERPVSNHFLPIQERGFFDEPNYAAEFLPPAPTPKAEGRAVSFEDFTAPTARANNREQLFEKNNIPRTYRSETGTVYQSVTEERVEINERGEQVTRIYVKYQPVDEKEMISAANQGFGRPLPQNEKPTIPHFMESGKGAQWQNEGEGSVGIFH